MLEMLHQLYLGGWEFADARLEVYGTNEFEKWYAKGRGLSGKRRRRNHETCDY